MKHLQIKSKNPLKLLIALSCVLVCVASCIAIYYFAVALPRQQSAYTKAINQLKRENSNLQDSIDALHDNQNSGVTQDDVQSSVENAINEDRQQQANCERVGGRYQGDGMCVYY